MKGVYSFIHYEKFCVSLFFFPKEINTFIQQGCITLIKSDIIKEVVDGTKIFHKCCSLEQYIYQRALKKSIMFPQKY